MTIEKCKHVYEELGEVRFCANYGKTERFEEGQWWPDNHDSGEGGQ